MPTADEQSRPFFCGIVLAAGTSTRMGQPKQLLRVGDRCLLQHVLDEAGASRLDELILVLGHRAEDVRDSLRTPADDKLRFVTNPSYEGGQSSSLRLGLQAANSQAHAAAILLGDQPQVTRVLIDRILTAFKDVGTPAARPVYCAANGQRQPGHPVVLARRIWPEAEELRGDQGARQLFSAHPDWLTEIPIAGEPPLDIDSREDYAQALTVFATAR